MYSQAYVIPIIAALAVRVTSTGKSCGMLDWIAIEVTLVASPPKFFGSELVRLLVRKPKLHRPCGDIDNLGSECVVNNA